MRHEQSGFQKCGRENIEVYHSGCLQHWFIAIDKRVASLLAEEQVEILVIESEEKLDSDSPAVIDYAMS